MNFRTWLTFMLCVLTVSILSIPCVYPAETTVVYVNPKHIDSLIGQSFTINISITHVTNLNTWQLYLLFNPIILNCTNVWVPPENIFQGHEIFWPTPKINNSVGSILAFCALTGTFGVDASGTLCQISFKCKTPGVTMLSIANEMQAPTGTYLQGPPPDYDFIPFEATDGVTEVGGSGFQEYVFPAIQNSNTYYVLIFSNSTVTSFNYDQALKTMTFIASGPDHTIGLSYVVMSKELLNGTFAVLLNDAATYYTTFENETHNFLSFSYSHSTKNVKILLTIKGDVNGDRKVDMIDIVIVILAYGSYPTHPKWNPLADISGSTPGVPDGKVDMLDIVFLILRFGKIWKPY